LVTVIYYCLTYLIIVRIIIEREKIGGKKKVTSEIPGESIPNF